MLVCEFSCWRIWINTHIFPAISNAIADTIEQMEEDSEDASEEEKARLVVIGYITDETLLTPDFRSPGADSATSVSV